VGGDGEGGRRGPLADAGLQHPQLAALDGELDVAQVAVVVLQCGHVPHQLGERAGVEVREAFQRYGVAHPGDDVLALGVGEVVAVAAARAGGGVAGEGDAGARRGAEVAEDHGHDVDRGAEALLDVLLAAVDPGALGVPGAEHGRDRGGQLHHRLLREVLAGVVLVHLLVLFHQVPQVLDGEVGVGGDAGVVLGVGQQVLELLGRHAAHGATVHLDQPPVGVPGGPGVARHDRQRLDRDVVEADVEDRLHHAGHREPGAGADGEQQRVDRVAEGAAHRGLDVPQRGRDLVVQAGRHRTGAQVLPARLGGHGEPGRDRQAESGHLGEVGALAPEQIGHVTVAFCEGVYQAVHRYLHV
jgi:hypothetical protein